MATRFKPKSKTRIPRSAKPAASARLSGVAWDTSGHALVLAATAGGRAECVRRSDLAYHSEKLFLTLRAAASKLRMDLSKLDFVAAAAGPGSFTGTRVGVTAAKALSYASGAKLILISSLELVAANLAGEKRSVCVIQDARRGKVFAATYRDGKAVRLPQLVHAGDVLFRLEPGTVYTGDAVPHFAEAIVRKLGRAALIRDRRRWHPQPAALLALAEARFAAKRFDDPLNAVPDYLYEDTCNVTVEKKRHAG